MGSNIKWDGTCEWFSIILGINKYIMSVIFIVHIKYRIKL
jgi:hypothetical protein